MKRDSKPAAPGPFKAGRPAGAAGAQASARRAPLSNAARRSPSTFLTTGGCAPALAGAAGAKEALRRELRERLARLLPGDFRAAGEKAAAHICGDPLWESCRRVFLFLSTKSEIDTLPLIEAALKAGKKVFAPRTAGMCRLVFYRLESAAGPWRTGPFGIREPAGTRPASARDFPALIITPGLGFDGEGNRLGQGGGFYDRFFAELDRRGRDYHAAGLCMKVQRLPRIPAAAGDKRVSLVWDF